MPRAPKTYVAAEKVQAPKPATLGQELPELRKPCGPMPLRRHTTHNQVLRAVSVL